MLDLLRVTVEAGMPPARALGVVGARVRRARSHADGARVAAEIALGVAAGRGACGDLPSGCRADEVASFVDGADAQPPSRRAARPGCSRARPRPRASAGASRVREQAARAGPKIQLVVALLLVPSVLLMVAAGLVAELERAGLVLAC